jgi:hypothetical protein
MGYDNPDLYYQPEAFGITTIGEVSWHEESYEFDFTVVWQSKEDPKLFYWARDSGCSCPSPFEDYTSLDHDGVEKGTRQEVCKALFEELDHVKKVNESYSWRTYDPSDSVLELVGKLVRL